VPVRGLLGSSEEVPLCAHHKEIKSHDLTRISVFCYANERQVYSCVISEYLKGVFFVPATENIYIDTHKISFCRCHHHFFVSASAQLFTAFFIAGEWDATSLLRTILLDAREPLRNYFSAGLHTGV
jgi:hypothetical protein